MFDERLMYGLEQIGQWKKKRVLLLRRMLINKHFLHCVVILTLRVIVETFLD